MHLNDFYEFSSIETNSFLIQNGEMDNRVVTKSVSLNGHIFSLWLYHHNTVGYKIHSNLQVSHTDTWNVSVLLVNSIKFKKLRTKTRILDLEAVINCNQIQNFFKEKFKK